MLRRMENAKRATIYFDPEVHRALRLKAAASDRSISDVVNEIVTASLAEDVDDLAAFAQRKKEKSLTCATFVQRLRRRGRL